MRPNFLFRLRVNGGKVGREKVVKAGFRRSGSRFWRERRPWKVVMRRRWIRFLDSENITQVDGKHFHGPLAFWIVCRSFSLCLFVVSRDILYVTYSFQYWGSGQSAHSGRSVGQRKIIGAKVTTLQRRKLQARKHSRLHKAMTENR